MPSIPNRPPVGTYDHRLIDGRQSVTFLVKVKEALEDPTRILLDV
jgi:2-oxoglutarate dehydrogenase E2 component (dihydrolipoamide succinyltransferase)